MQCSRHPAFLLKAAFLPMVWLLALAPASVAAHIRGEGGPVFRTCANEVRIVFAASDRQGHRIRSLRSSDVAVADNGEIVRQFRSFQPVETVPLNVVLVIDASGSVAADLAGEVAEARNLIEGPGWGAGDRVSILVFGGTEPRLLCSRNCRGGVGDRLKGLRADGFTPLYDALVAASDILRETQDPGARPAMVLVSDGMDTISRSTLADASQAAQQMQAPIYAVNSRRWKTATGEGEAVLDYLAASTGGLSFAPGQRIDEVLRMVLEDLREGYVLTYEQPRENPGEHSVRLIPTSNAGLRFRSRHVYDGGSAK